MRFLWRLCMKVRYVKKWFNYISARNTITTLWQKEDLQEAFILQTYTAISITVCEELKNDTFFSNFGQLAYEEVSHLKLSHIQSRQRHDLYLTLAMLYKSISSRSALTKFWQRKSVERLSLLGTICQELISWLEKSSVNQLSNQLSFSL